MVLRQNLWVVMIDFAKEVSGLRPDGFIALVPIPKEEGWAVHVRLR
jgi:hypothetical protein